MARQTENILEVWQNEFLQRSTILWHIDSVIAFRIDYWLYGKEPAKYASAVRFPPNTKTTITQDTIRLYQRRLLSIQS